MADTTHKFPSLGCAIRVSRSKFACPDHWYALPESMRAAITATYKQRRDDHGRSHMMAMLDAKNYLKVEFTKEGLA